VFGFFVPINVLKGSPSFRDVPNITALLIHVLCPKLSSFHLYRWARGAALDLPIETSSVLGASKVSVFLVMSVSKSLIAKAKKRNVQHERHPHAINIKMNKKPINNAIAIVFEC
jgi:hypothetical protein